MLESAIIRQLLLRIIYVIRTRASAPACVGWLVLAAALAAGLLRPPVPGGEGEKGRGCTRPGLACKISKQRKKFLPNEFVNIAIRYFHGIIGLRY